MTNAASGGSGTRDDRWNLTTPPGTSEYQMYRDGGADPPALVCVVGKTLFAYRLSCIDGLAELEHNPRNNRMRAR